MVYDYSNLLGAMRRKGITQEQLARLVGKSEATFNRKLCGAREFKQSEMLKFSRCLRSQKIPFTNVGGIFYLFTFNSSLLSKS